MTEQRALAALEASGVAFTITRHGPVSSLVEAATARGVAPSRLIKTLVVRRDTDDYLFVLVPGGRHISWPKLRAILGVSRLSMPDKEIAFEVTGYERGTITPFGSLYAWPVIADQHVVNDPEDSAAASGPERAVSIGAGAPGVAAMIVADDLVNALGAQIADVTDPE